MDQMRSLSSISGFCLASTNCQTSRLSFMGFKSPDELPNDLAPLSSTVTPIISLSLEAELRRAWRRTSAISTLDHDPIRRSRIMISSLCLSMISAQTLRVCREGKPVSTFPDHALGSGRLFLRGKAAVEGFALFRHLFQKLRRREARAVLGLELVAQLDEFFRAHEIDVGQRPSRERRKTEAQDRAHIGLARIDDDVILDRARGLHRLHHEKALLQLVDVERVGVEMLRLQVRKARPQAFLPLALLRIVVKALAVLAPQASLLFDQLDHQLLVRLVDRARPEIGFGRLHDLQSEI